MEGAGTQMDSEGYRQDGGALLAALKANRPGSGIDHVLVALPSYSVGESLLSHYADRIPALEHRYLVPALMLGRIPTCELVFVSSRAPAPEVVDLYFDCLPSDAASSARRRFHTVIVDDDSPLSVAEKLLSRPDLLERIRTIVGTRVGFIEPWNVTPAEVEVACQLGLPLNGTNPALWPLGFKSTGRRLFREAGVPLPDGVEDITDVEGILDAVVRLRRANPELAGVVVKHDDSGSGDGNVVLDLSNGTTALRRALDALPGWYVDDLAQGGVVEEMVVGQRFTSPSAQVDLLPDGMVSVLATHEQILGGPSAQVYQGCRFPADTAYAPELAAHARAVGELLVERGALGRIAIDFACAERSDGSWRVAALEINLRKGGTTHPYAALRNLVPGRYDGAAGRWVSHADGTCRSYVASDNLVEPLLTGCAPGDVIDAVRGAQLSFDPTTGTGVVLHMLSCLAIDGRFGLTAIGRDNNHAAEMYSAVEDIVTQLATPPRRGT